MNDITVKQILDELANESSTNGKKDIIENHKDNILLKKVLYMAISKRVKFYIKQIPEYTSNPNVLSNNLSHMVLHDLSALSNRTVTGNAAIQYLKSILENLNPDDANIIERIIKKDLKVGIGGRNINKVVPNLIEKTGYMGCKPYSKDLVLKLLAKGKAYSQEKMDGRFVNGVIQGGEVDNESRQGETTNLDNPAFLTELVLLKDCVLNGELTMEGIPRYISNGIITSLISIATKMEDGKDATKSIANLEKRHMPYREALDLIRLTAWDMLTIDEYTNRSSKRPYNERLAELNETLKGFKMLSVVETRIVTTYAEAMEHFREVVGRDGEGTVLKSLDGEWKDTKPSYQIKIKKEVNLDLRIISFNYGEIGSKNENWISSINVESEDGLLKTSPTGMDEDEMEYVTEHQDELLNTILEVKCSGLSQDRDGNYSAMHPVCKNRRDDKTIANTLEECIEIDKASMF